MDKLKQSERKTNLKRLADAYDTLILPVSVPESAGLDQIWKLIRRWTHA
jgi:hypothetical protein